MSTRSWRSGCRHAAPPVVAGWCWSGSRPARRGPAPARPLVTRYQVQIGRCRACGRRVQPRHPEQVSDALGAAGTQLGPRAVALAAWLSKGLGVPAGKMARLFAQLGLRLTSGGVVQVVARAVRRCQPTYQGLTQGVRASPVVAPDETGWWVGGAKAWLWTFVGEQVTVYRIARGRGYADAAAVLGEGSAGVLERDGWAPYRRFVHATHQTCLRTCCGAAGNSWLPPTGAAKTPHAVRRILEHARCGYGTPTTPAPWMRPRWPPRPDASGGAGRQARRRAHRLPTQPPAAHPPGPRARAPVHLPGRRRHAGHQLACPSRPSAPRS